jgi:hypothetical protein
MATAASKGIPVPALTGADPLFTSSARRRRVSPKAGRALKVLSHAIEYLANEFLHDVLPPSAQNGRLQAVELLMALNRAVYFECPEDPVVSTLRERCGRFLGFDLT